MDFDNYTNRILSVNHCDFFDKPERVPQFNDKRFYVLDGITS